MTQLHNTSLHNIPGVTQIRTQPGSIFINPAGVHLEKQRAAAVQPEARTRPYAYVASLGLGAKRISGTATLLRADSAARTLNSWSSQTWHSSMMRSGWQRMRSQP